MNELGKIFCSGWAFSQLQTALEKDGVAFLVHALRSIQGLLPHLETDKWRTSKTPQPTRVKSVGITRLELNLTLQLTLKNECFVLQTIARRRRAEAGRGAEAKTLDAREFDLCRQILERTEAVLRAPTNAHSLHSLRAVRGLFVEQVVGAHLEKHLEIDFDMGQLFAGLRELAEQSYENKSLTYGLLIRDPQRAPRSDKRFPEEFFKKKRYRALSDGFRTAFEIDRTGRLLGIRDLQAGVNVVTGNHYYPEWCRYLACASSGKRCGIALTRQGDILVFDGGSLRFSYRAGKWQYWNHTHAVNIFRNRKRVRHVAPHVVSAVVNRVYRVALDVSFRRSGCLFVVLHNRNSLRRLVAKGDAIGDSEPDRNELYRIFDETFSSPDVQTLGTTLLVELSSLDGGIVIDNHGRILAYGAVLRTRGKSGASEGSRTKAALSASDFGVAVKVSSDGDISLYDKGREFLSL